MQLLVNGWFIHQLTTGSGQCLHQLMAQLGHLSTTGATAHRFTVLVPADQWRAGDPELWPGVTVIPIRLPALPKPLRKLWWEQMTIPWAAYRMRVDWLWVPYWAAPLWQPCPTAVTVHDLIHHLLPAYRGGRLQRLYTTLVAYTAQQAAVIFTVSHAAARDIATHLQIPSERIHVVYNGADQPVAQPDATFLAAVRAKYGLPARFFLYLGGFDLRKNVRTTLQAYRRYLDRGGDPAVRLVIAGKLPAQDSTFTPDPQKIAAELNLTTQVHFCGWIEEAEKPAFYALATAYLFPGLYEGFGLMVIEAMSAGTPVITSAS
ncbi:MAG: glycosyltransferase family 4 protein [Caldilineaceae bacterium]|nr:glycosyltransferase family 4 protein [Caldilineaceae bacterium]